MISILDLKHKKKAISTLFFRHYNQLVCRPVLTYRKYLLIFLSKKTSELLHIETKALSLHRFQKKQQYLVW